MGSMLTVGDERLGVETPNLGNSGLFSKADDGPKLAKIPGLWVEIHDFGDGFVVTANWPK